MRTIERRRRSPYRTSWFLAYDLDVELGFVVGNETARFVWHSFTGKAEIVVQDGRRVRLQSPFKLSTHYGLARERTWQSDIEGHRIEVTKVNPGAVAGLRSKSFTIRVDGEVAAKGIGR